ncbi:MAG: DUF4258 domain-containing protein [Ferruginibacter sp.]|nr:DUF4258 domain-containing protein [Ferruginibacter sp.]
MKNKNVSYLILLIAALFLFWIKNNQRGKSKKITERVTVENVTDAYTQLREGNKTIKYSRHAKCRMDCRHIDESEIKEILETGLINYNKEQETEKGITYPLEGTTHDGQHVRIVFAPHQNEITVVTAIDLDTNWPCGNCN